MLGASIKNHRSLAAQPACVTFAVSGPCTSWSVETWQECGLPSMVELLRKAFLAAVSGPNRNDNRAAVGNGLPPSEEATSISKRISSSRRCARKRMCNAMKARLSCLKQQRQRFVTENPQHPLALQPWLPLKSNAQQQQLQLHVQQEHQEQEQEENYHEEQDQVPQEDSPPTYAAQEYQAMELLAPGFIKAIADVRTAMLSMEPVERFRPAVVAFLALYLFCNKCSWRLVAART